MEKTEKAPRLWTGKFIAACVIGFALRIAFQIQGTSLPLYIQFIGGSKATAGLATTLAMFAAFLMRPLSGWLVDKYGRKWVMIIGILMFSITTLGFTWGMSMGLILVMRTLGGIASSVYTTASGTLVADSVPEEILGKGISVYGLTLPMAQAFAPSLALMIIGSNNNYAGSFYVNVGLALFAMALTIPIKFRIPVSTRAPAVEKKPVEKKSGLAGAFANMFNKDAMPATIVQFMLLMASASVMGFLAMYGLERGVDSIGTYFTVQAISVFGVRLFTGKLAEKFGYNKVILVSLCITALSLMSLAFCSQLWHFCIAGFAMGCGSGAAQPLLNAAAIVKADVNQRGSANATYYAGMDIGMAVGSFILGYVADWFGLSVMFFVSGCMCLLIFPVYKAVLYKQIKDLH